MSELLTVGDLKQWVYCPRVTYYHKFLAGAGAPTYKMREGRAAQDWFERLEGRRELGRYGLAQARRRFGVWLASAELGLSGKIDLLLEAEDQAAVVDFKLTAGEVAENHRMQLAAYALLVETELRLRSSMGFVYRIPDDAIFEVRTEKAEQERVKEVMAAIHETIRRECLPEATEVRSRCADCEYINFCADVW